MLKRMFSRAIKPYRKLVTIEQRLTRLEKALGRVEARQTALVKPGALSEAEFQVYSQWGEDGIIEHLIRHIPMERKVFVEFGVQDYHESNTRFLLTNRNWSGLVIDGSEDNIGLVKGDPIYWQHRLKAVAKFITRDNIDELILSEGISGDIGVLSVDIDGNDYWVWERIESVSPRIVVAEYNGIFGPSAAVSVPYDPEFVRARAHYSHLYWGCSLAALAHLGAAKGYALVGCNSAANNAFFVRRDVLGLVPARSVHEAYREPHFREARDLEGNLTFLDWCQALDLIADLPLHDVVTQKALRVRDVAPALECGKV